MGNQKETPTGLVVFGVICLIIIFVGAAFAKTSEKSDNTNKTETVKEEPKKDYTKTEKKYEDIAYSTKTAEDSSLEYGTTEVRTQGKAGRRVREYEVVYKDGKEVSRKEISNKVETNPVDKVVAKGTKIIWRCVDATSYDKNPYNDNRCTSSTGEVRYVSDSQSRALDPSYSPGKSGHSWYNNQ